MLENRNLNPFKITYLKDLTKDSYAQFWLDNTFTVFKSVDNLLLLIYSTKNLSIISYNIIENKKLNEIKKAHDDYIVNFRHFLENNKRDLVLSISSDNNNLKLWDANNLECLLNLENVNKNGFLYSAILFKDNNECTNYQYIVTCHDASNNVNEPIKLFDIKGNKVKEIYDSKYRTFFLESYYDIQTDKYYIITGNNGHLRSYDYNSNILYHKYDEKDNKYHDSLLIYNNEKLVKLIDSSCSGEIRIWDFHSSILLKKIKVSESWLKGISLLNNKYLFIACKDKLIKLLDLKTGNVIQNIIGHNNYVITIKIIFHPLYGQCLISQGVYDEQIKLWRIQH